MNGLLKVRSVPRRPKFQIKQEHYKRLNRLMNEYNAYSYAECVNSRGMMEIKHRKKKK